MSFSNFFHPVYKLVESDHSNIFNVVDKHTDRVTNYIVKHYENVGCMRREVNILRKIEHLKYVPKIVEIQKSYVMMTKIPGVDLYELLITKKIKFSEDELRMIIHKLLHIIKDIHSLNIVHRDIKPENIMYDRRTKRVYLIDFDQKITKRYISPEVIYDKGLHDKRADAWSVGVVCYNMVTKNHPWYTDDSVLIKPYTKIRKKCSEELLDFIDRLLEKNITDRMSIDESFEHPWIKNVSLNKSCQEKDLVENPAEIHTETGEQKEKRFVI